MSKHLTEAFEAADKRGRAAFVGFVTAGYPTREETVDIMLGMQKGGTDIIELGVPFTDPLADGASIQRTSEVALAHANPISLTDCLSLTKAARAAGVTVPVVLMGYFNPFLMYGLDKLMDDSKASGVSGFIVVDLPPSPGVKLMDFGFARCCDTGEGAAPFDSLSHRWHLLQSNASDDEESCLGWANRSRIDHRARHEGFSVLNPASGRWCDQFRSLSMLSWNSSMEAPRGECSPEPREPVEQRLPAGCARSKGAGPRAYHIDEKRGLVIMQHNPNRVVGSTMQMKMAGSQVRAASVGLHDLHDEKRGSLVILQSTKASPREWPNPKTLSMPLRRNPW